MALLCLWLQCPVIAQSFILSRPADGDSTSVDGTISRLAVAVLESDTGTRRAGHAEDFFRLQVLAGRYRESLETIHNLYRVSLEASPYRIPSFLGYEVYARTYILIGGDTARFDTAYKEVFYQMVEKLDDRDAYRSYGSFYSPGGVDASTAAFRDEWSSDLKKALLNYSEALNLCTRYFDARLFQKTEETVRRLILDDCHRRYGVTNRLVRIHDGVQIEVITVLKKGFTHPLPAALQYTIYADSGEDVRLYAAAAYGYAGVTAYSRGKGTSPDSIVPYEHDGADANDIITWISRQPWCNGAVGMYGGSYNGFTQWSAAKYHNPALKTIVPYVAAIPGQGLPMENNVFLNANYGWAFYTTDNRYLDQKLYDDPQLWRSLNWKWYDSGAAYNRIDSVDGTPNPWLQRWLQHPSYDRYWQQQVPYRKDFAGIRIPVLTFEGYYDDGQISGLKYYLDHLRYNPGAYHYLIIGPYDHFGTQSGGVPVLRGYAVDPVALIGTRDITFQWLDHILKGARMPSILRGHVNYEVMGANTWRHVSSVARMADTTWRFYLAGVKNGRDYMLMAGKPAQPGWLNETADFTNRQVLYGDYYPFPIIKSELDHSNGLFFMSAPLDREATISGMFKGNLQAMINKKDFDITVTLYEVTPDGRYFELSYYLGRASYAKDMTRRTLLHPGKLESIPFSRTRLVCRRLPRGSRLLVVLNTDINPFAEINYGTGRDVATETIADGKTPLKIRWSTASYIDVPVQLK